MRIEWLLTELDKKVRTYTDLRAQLNKFPTDGEAYSATKRGLQTHLMRLRAEIENVLDALAEDDTTEGNQPSS